MTQYGFSAITDPKEILDTPLNQVDEILNSAAGTDICKMIDVVINTERMDLLQEFFQSPYAYGYFLMRVNDDQDSEFKDKIVVMMLRTESNFWPPYQDPSQLSPNGSQRTNNYHNEQPFVGVFKKYFPKEELTKEMVERRKSRLLLADRIEAALLGNSPDTIKSEAERAADSKQDTVPEDSQQNLEEATTEQEAVNPDSKKETLKNEKKKESVQKIPNTAFWPLIGGGMLVVLAGYFYLRFWRRQRIR